MESCIDLLHHSGSPTWTLSSSVSQEALSPCSSPELLNSSTTDMLGWIILHHAIFLWKPSNVPGFYLLVASTTHLPICDNQLCLQTLPNVTWEAKSPCMRTTGLASWNPASSDVSHCFSPGQQAHSSHQNLSTQSSDTKTLACLKTPVKQMSQTFLAIQVCSSPLKFKLL